MSDIANILFGALLGTLLSLVGGFLAEQLNGRRRLWATARILLHELQRLWESAEHRELDDSAILESLRPSIEAYKVALFEVDRIEFEDHWPVYRDLIRVLDSDREPSHKETLLVLDTRRRLAAILGVEQPGAAEILGVSETGSPVHWEKSPEDA